MSIITEIERIAGPQRAKTFLLAVEFVLSHPEEGSDKRMLLETGCYRGNPGDGNSTLSLANLAKFTGRRFISFDNNPKHCEIARAMLAKEGLTADHVSVDCIDSIVALRSRSPLLAYLDSYDHEEHNPGPCQRHSIAEVGALVGGMVAPCALLFDDNVISTGGKPLLAKAFLQDRGWKLANDPSDYQLLFTLT